MEIALEVNALALASARRQADNLVGRLFLLPNHDSNNFAIFTCMQHEAN